MAPSTWNTSGKSPSTEASLYKPYQVASKTAGYLGLANNKQIVEVFNCGKFQEIFNLLQNTHTEHGWSMPGPGKFITNATHIKRKKYGNAKPNKSGWDETDHTWHAVMLLVKASTAGAFPHKMLLEPQKGEKDIEAHNRAFQLLKCYKYYLTSKPPRLNSINLQTKAIVPDFMKSISERGMGIEAPRLETYPPRSFTIGVDIANSEMPANYRWRGELQAVMKVDPRVHHGPAVRDWVRREFNMVSHKVQIHELGLEYNGWTTSWPNIKKHCINHEDATSFMVTIRPLGADEELFESEIPATAEGFTVDENGMVVRTPTDTNLENQAFEIDRDEGSTGDQDSDDPNKKKAKSDDIPLDFYPPEDPTKHGFDPSDPNHDGDRLKFMEKMATHIDAVGLATVSRRARQHYSDEDLVAHVLAIPTAAISDDRPQGNLQELIAKARQSDLFLGPDLSVSCKILGLTMFNLQMPGVSRPFLTHQITGIVWCLLHTMKRFGGTVEKNEAFQQLGPKPTGGGIIQDEMGTGKTDTALGFILAAASNFKTHRPSVVICPAQIVHVWVERVLTYFPALKVFIFHSGANKGRDSYKDIRIGRNAFASYDPNKGANSISSEKLRYMFNKNDPQASNTVIITTYNTWRSRAGFETREIVDDEEVRVWHSKLPSVFRTVILDEAVAVKNPDSQTYQVIKESRPGFFFLLTGTPMQNRMHDLEGLLSMLSTEEIDEHTMERIENGDLDPFDDNANHGPDILNLRANPRVFKHVMKIQDLPMKTGMVKKVLEYVSIRRTRGSKIPVGDGSNMTVRVGTQIPALEINTKEVIMGPHQAAETQVAHSVYANQLMQNLGKGRQKDSNGKERFSYPSAIHRRLCLTSNGPLFERLLVQMEREGLPTLADDIAAWRTANPPVDYRWLADKTKHVDDPVMNITEEYLTHMVQWAPKLQILVEDVWPLVVTHRQKVVVFYEWWLTGLILELFFKAQCYRVTMLAPGMSGSEKSGILKAFNTVGNFEHEIILCPYKTSSFGIDLIGAARIYLFEPGINISTELQAISRVVREGQLQAVTATRLFTTGTFDTWRENKATEKIIPEIAMYRTNEEMSRLMRRLVLSANGLDEDEEEDIDLSDPKVLNQASRLVVQKLLGQDCTRLTKTPHVDYSLLKKRTISQAELD